MNKWIIMAIVTIGCFSLPVLAERPYIVDASGNKIEGDGIQADERGDIGLQIGAATRTFRRGAYEYAYTPKPADVARLERALEQQNYDAIIDRAEGIFDNYKILGWAGRIAFIHAEALLAKEQPEIALSVLDMAQNFAHLNKEQMQMARVNTLLDLGRVEEAEKILRELKKAASDEIAAFAFNASGKLLVEKGRKQDAVLEYLKTLLVVRPEGATHARNVALEQVVELLREIGDPRYEQFIE